MIGEFLKKNKLKILLKVGKYFAYFVLGCMALVLVLFIYYTYDLPQPEKFTETPFIQPTKIYDRTGKVLLYSIYGEEKREVVPFDKISDNLKHAVLAAEDARFYQHGGIDFKSILRSILVDLKLQSVSQGASTITQQLIRSVYLSNQRTLERKIREVVLSIELDARYSKDQIFDWYLNQIPFGQNAYGAEAAAQTYFNKPASDLTIAEAAALTALIPAPSARSPYGSNKDTLLKNKDIVLDKMKEAGFIDDKQLADAKNEKLVFADIVTPIKAPHFVMYVEKYLQDKYGEDYLKEKGLKVYTTLDWDLQSYVEQTIKDANQRLLNKGANNAAAVVVDPNSGEILALVGSKDYFGKPYPEGCDQKLGSKCLFTPNFDVATMGHRQPGSSFKPFVYATAFKEGYTPNTLLWDVQTEFNPSCGLNADQTTGYNGSACYHPHDYDGRNRGQITIRKSLQGSLNIPSVELLYLAGLNNSLQTAQDMGITTLTDPSSYGLALVLGGGDVNLLEMTSAYGVFATEGYRWPAVSILKIEDTNGNIIEQKNTQATKVLSTQVCREMNNVLSDNDARTFIFGPNSSLNVPGYQVAVKTGTTQYFNDGWAVGYNPSISVGVWVGNNDNSPTQDEGVGTAAPIWNKIITKIISEKPQQEFTAPDPVQNINPVLLGQLPSGDPPHSILYYIDRSNPLGPPPQNPSQDPLYPFWETGVQNFINRVYTTNDSG